MIHNLHQRLKKILLDDELGICPDLEREMDALVGTFYDEWKVVVEDPARQKQFRQFVNTVSFPLEDIRMKVTYFLRMSEWSPWRQYQNADSIGLRIGRNQRRQLTSATTA